MNKKNITVMTLIIISGVGMIYEYIQNTNLLFQLQIAYQNSTNLMNLLTITNDQLLITNSDMTNLKVQNNNLTLGMQMIEKKNTYLTNQLQHPTLRIWNVNQSVAIGYHLFGAMFDTFDNHIQLQTDSPINVYVLENSEYAKYQTSQAFSNVEEHSGTNIDFWFNLSEGCSGYVYVIESAINNSFTIYPNVTVYYNPATTATGACI